MYVEQPLNFEDFEKPDHVYKLQTLYGLKQALRASYERLSKFLMEKGFSRGSVDATLFLNKHKHDMLVAQIYVHDIYLVLLIKACVTILLKKCKVSLK